MSAPIIFDPVAFGAGALNFVLAFVAAGGFTLIFKALYRWITPHDEGALIRAGNSAAAIALGGALLGYVIPLASALTQTHTLPEFVAWAILAGVIQIATFWLVRRIALPDVSARIERGEIAPALYLMMISISVGILNAACMTA
jgi:putative membrane protein